MKNEDAFNINLRAAKKKLNLLPPNPENPPEERAVGLGRFPSWLHRKLPQGNHLWQTGSVVRENRLNTVCEEAKCPNLLECWSKKTATFLVMGKECTRACGFCDIDFTKTPKSLEDDEPNRIADSVTKLGLKHVVITMVARDDLSDGGASHLVRIVEAVRQSCPEVTLELLTSDFQGNHKNLKTVLQAKPEIFNHNIETVRALTPKVRHTATYEISLQVLKTAKTLSDELSGAILIKSGMMVGLGESKEEVYQTLEDLKDVGCDIVTIGQYLQPHRHKLRVKEFVPPSQFLEYENYGLKIGIPYMYSGPFVRSSYNANVVIKRALGAILINSE